MKRVKLNYIAIFVLFVTSYIPLFGLLILRQIKQNINYLKLKVFTKENLFLALEKFGLSGFLLAISIFGYIGSRLLLENLDIRKSNGELVKISQVENKNNESITYISTYIVPFMYQDTNNLFDIVSIFILLTIIFFIYMKSNMIVINPILSISYNLYQIDYSKKGRTRKALLITKEEYIESGQEIKINLITKNIYYG